MATCTRGQCNKTFLSNLNTLLIS